MISMSCGVLFSSILLVVLISMSNAKAISKDKHYDDSDPVVATLNLDINKLLPAFLSEIIETPHNLEVKIHASDFKEAKDNSDKAKSKTGGNTSVKPPSPPVSPPSPPVSPPAPPSPPPPTTTWKQEKPVLSLMGNGPLEGRSADDELLLSLIKKLQTDSQS